MISSGKRPSRENATRALLSCWGSVAALAMAGCVVEVGRKVDFVENWRRHVTNSIGELGEVYGRNGFSVSSRSLSHHVVRLFGRSVCDMPLSVWIIVLLACTGSCYVWELSQARLVIQAVNFLPKWPVAVSCCQLALTSGQCA